MRFGISLTGHVPLQTEAELARVAEQSGFDHVWAWDNQMLGQDAFALLTLAADRTERILLGTCVTNPVTRDPTVLAGVFATLNNFSGGRMICGIGRGDSAVRMQKVKPSNLAALEDAIHVIRELGAGRTAEVAGNEIQFGYAQDIEVPVFVAAYGPKALTLAGRVADGVILQIADPAVIKWCVGFVRAGAEAAGRDPDAIHVQCAAPLRIGDDIAELREAVRWFPALVGNHISDLLRHHAPADLPAELTEYVQHRTTYDYAEHTRPGAQHAAYVPDAIVDRFTVIGTPERCAERLEELAAIGVTEMNVYLKVDDPAALVRDIGEQLVPLVRDPSGASA